MTAARILFDQTAVLKRAAAYDAAGRMIDLFIDRLDRPSFEGGVYWARVQQILKDRNAAFVDLGGGRRGLLAAADVRPAPGKAVAIGTVLRAGQMLIVQVKADATGDKAATVSMDAALLGRFLTHLPRGRGVAVSRRLASDETARKALRAAYMQILPAAAGWIVRGAAAQMAFDHAATAATAETAALIAAWAEIQAKATGEKPRLLAPPPDALARALTAYNGAETLTTACAPLDSQNLATTLAALLRPETPLPHGGSLIIETTAAFTAVDVNGGGRGNPLAINLAAADELARQLRLRNLGGGVVADFIRMDSRNEQEQVLARLRRAVADDPAQTDIYGFTRLGHVELTRARRGRSLSETLDGLTVSAF